MQVARSSLPLRLAASCCVFALLLATLPEQPWHWDEFQLAAAIDDFDLSRHQPHPPGYYLFVVAGRVLDALLGDPFLALRVLSALAVAAFAGLAVGGRAAGTTPVASLLWCTAAAGFALLSPLTQRFGVAALTYASEGALWLVWLLWFGGGTARQRPLLAGLAGLAAGVRPTLALWAGAVLVWDVARHRRWRSLPWIGLAGAAGIALWAIPLLWEAGGLDAYRTATGPLAWGNVWSKSVFVAGVHGWGSRLGAMGLDLLTALGGLVVLVPIAAMMHWQRPPDSAHRNAPLLAGAALAFAFYALVIYDSPGYLLAVVLPLAAWTLRTAAAGTASWPAPRQAAAAAGALALIAAGSLLPAGRIAIDQPAHARLLASRLAPVHEGFAPRDTVLITSREYWDYALRHVAHALPAFTTLQLARDPFFTISDTLRPYLVAHETRIAAFGPDPLDLSRLLPGGTLRNVVYMVPFDAEEFVSQSCEELRDGLPTGAGEVLPVLRLRPGWRVEARGQRLHCVRGGALGGAPTEE